MRQDGVMECVQFPNPSYKVHHIPTVRMSRKCKTDYDMKKKLKKIHKNTDLVFHIAKVNSNKKIFCMQLKPKQRKKEESRKRVQLPEAATVSNCS